MKYLLLMGVVVLALLGTPDPAWAGDGATIVLRSGAVIRVNNGYTQIERGMRDFTKKGGDNYGVEIKLQGTTFFLNLGEVALLCRDRCSSLEIVWPKAEKK